MKKIFGLLVILVLIHSSTLILSSSVYALEDAGGYEVGVSESAIESGEFNKMREVDNSNDLTETNEKKFEKNLEQKLSKQNNSVSVIEDLFDGKLKQFGYEIFGNGVSQTYNSKIPDNYILKIGDKVNLYFWGSSIDVLTSSGSSSLSPFVKTMIDTQGNIFVPSIGVLNAKGKTLKQIEKQIYSKLSKRISDFRVRVSVHEPGNQGVMVVGNIKRPGVIYLDSSASILDALSLAGGILKEGSLRNIKYISKKKSGQIDLYNVLIKGKVQDISLKDGDVILVNPIGKVIALSDGVKKPGIYEFTDNENMEEVIGFAGGLLPSSNIDKLEIESFDNSIKQRVFKNVNINQLDKIKPNDGDLVKFKELYKIPENIVVLKGNVKSPGGYEFKAGMKLSDVIKSSDDMLVNTFVAQAIITRVINSQKDVVNIPISLIDFFNGVINPELKRRDIITIYPGMESEMVFVKGCIKNPGSIPFRGGMTLGSILGSLKFDRNVNDIAVEIKSLRTDNAAIYLKRKIKSLNLDENKEEADENDRNAESLNELNVRIVYLYEYLTQNAQGNVNLKPGDSILFRPLLPKEALRTLEITGYVVNPGVYKIKPGLRLSDVISEAGGLKSGAFLNGLVFTRPSLVAVQNRLNKENLLRYQEELTLESTKFGKKDGMAAISQEMAMQDRFLNLFYQDKQKLKGRIAINIQNNELSPGDNIEIKDGDKIHIPSEPGYVLLVGEVNNQSAIAYMPNKPLKHYINKAGGLKKEARKNQIYIVKANGITVKPGKLMAYKPGQGDSVVIPKKYVQRVNKTEVVKSLADGAFKLMSIIFMMDRL